MRSTTGNTHGNKPSLLAITLCRSFSFIKEFEISPEILKLPYPLVNDDWWESVQKIKGHGNVVDTNSKNNQASVFPLEQENCHHYGWKFRRKEYIVSDL